MSALDVAKSDWINRDGGYQFTSYWDELQVMPMITALVARIDEATQELTNLMDSLDDSVIAGEEERLAVHQALSQVRNRLLA